MILRPSAADFNRLFRGKPYGRHPIFTARSYARFVASNEIDLARAVCAFDGNELIGALAFAQRGDRAWMGLVAVREDRRRDGIGRRLFVEAYDALRASGARSIELETVQHNRAAIEMVATFGFRPVGELYVWARKPRPRCRALPPARALTDDEAASLAGLPAACWQREPRSLARAGTLHAIGVPGAHAFVGTRGGSAMLLDAHARDGEAARALLDELDARVGEDLTLNNEPPGTPLAAELARRDGWRIVERQYRIAGA